MRNYDNIRRKAQLNVDPEQMATGKDYVPWTKTSDFSSKGRATRIFSPKLGRIVHLQSDNQLRAFLTYEFCPRTLDLRESWPLLDVLEVIDDKENLRFDKFQDKTTGQRYVITTSFLLTVRDLNGNQKYLARTVKNTTELNRKMTWEKLEIERRYWSAKGIDWKLVTENQLSRQVAKNILWVRETLLNDSNQVDKEKLSIRLHNYLFNNNQLALRDVLKEFDRAEDVSKGTGLYLFRYLIATRRIRVDMHRAINTSQPIRSILM